MDSNGTLEYVVAHNVHICVLEGADVDHPDLIPIFEYHRVLSEGLDESKLGERIRLPNCSRDEPVFQIMQRNR